MKIFITGANGQFGRACEKKFSRDELFLASHETLDITNFEQCRQLVAKFDPDIVIHSAAYTNVKKAEVEKELCWRVNVEGTKNMVWAAEGRKFVYISTDYVFDGKATVPYLETDATNPLGVYGRSKLEAEKAVIEGVTSPLILRTSWLFGEGKNFVQTMLKLCEAQTSLPVVADQHGCPTFTHDLADWTYKLVQNKNYGIYHASNSEPTTWADFAIEIFRLKNISVKVERISSEEFSERFNDTTPRPKYSVLNTNKLKGVVGEIRSWKEALADYLN